MGAKNGRWKKRVASLLYEDTHLRRSACIHALCVPEAKAIRAYGLKNPICIIPNGVDLPAQNDKSVPLPWEESFSSKNILLYLGRIHPKKGLTTLLRSWHLVKTKKTVEAENWRLVIAGWDQGGHENELKAQCYSLNLNEDVFFAGPMFGVEKSAALRNATAFVLPSLSEGLPLVVLEAWSHSLPVMMTPACNLPEGFETSAAIRVEPEIESLAQGLQKLFEMTIEERTVTGANGNRLVRQRFLWPAIADQMRAVYDWLLHNAPRPECIFD